MLSYAYVTASRPLLRDGIESTSRSILAPYRLPERGRSILARRVIRRRPFCVICLATPASRTGLSPKRRPPGEPGGRR
jgi:hypothetical protein